MAVVLWIAFAFLAVWGFRTTVANLGDRGTLGRVGRGSGSWH